MLQNPILNDVAALIERLGSISPAKAPVVMRSPSSGDLAEMDLQEQRPGGAGNRIADRPRQGAPLRRLPTSRADFEMV
jgi:hypothetical protein